MKHPSDEFYERCAIEATKVMAPMVDVNGMTIEGWTRFVSDIFDLTDALCSELCVRLERNEKLRIEDAEITEAVASGAFVYPDALEIEVARQAAEKAGEGFSPASYIRQKWEDHKRGLNGQA